jgi:uncharacterized protein YndB with AHSA1/START domain/uncharacterized protein YciI
MTQLPPIRRQVVVRGSVQAAFEVFTGDIGDWWPLGEHSVYGNDSTVAVRDGRVVERGSDGQESVWGSILDWEPPSRFRMTWHPGSEPANASEVEVRFSRITADQTLVTLEHVGWERFPDPVGARTEYDHGWLEVLGAYTKRAPDHKPLVGNGPIWLALMHTPGPAVQPGAQVTAHLDFAEHIAFLQGLHDRGVLVAAGSLDGAASGMTVLRIPDPADVEMYIRMAQEDDESVVRGLLLVQARPWSVALDGMPDDD